MRSPQCEIFILAGGLSTRMGYDKSRVRLGRHSLLQHIRAAASQLPFPVRVIRRDAVPRCGPIGGIYTALKRSRADSILLLACDMPFISPSFLKKMIKAFHLAPPARQLNTPAVECPPLPIALFARENKLAGFPCLLRREPSLPIVFAQIATAQFSLQALAKKLRAKTLSPPRAAAIQLTNINTPADLQKASRRANI